MKLSKEQIFGLYYSAGYTKCYDYVTGGEWDIDCFEAIDNIDNSGYTENSDVLILRKFGDFTKEETEHISEFMNYENVIKTKECATEYVLYLLSIGIDLFGAIEKGYAKHIKEVR